MPCFADQNDLERNALQAALSNHETALNGKAEPVVRLLVEGGANPNPPPSESYCSILQAAIENGNGGLVGILLEAGVDINAHDPRFGTALTSTARYGSFAAVKYLLDRGADPTLGGGKYG
jgi:ankyrin repeat protein